MKFEDIHIAVISHKRPDNVKLMEEKTGVASELHWYVGLKEEEDYRHAKGMVIGGGDLVASRNMALNYAATENKYCLMLDDDLEKVTFFTTMGETVVDFETMVREMYNVLKSSPLFLAGTASTTNRFFFNPNSPLGLKHFIGGWCTLTKKGSVPRYDPALKTKEDYDITLEHVSKYGGVLRLNYVAPKFKHWNNPGGVVDYRTAEVEQKSIKYLKKKWKGAIRDNTKRPNEILLKL